MKGTYYYYCLSFVMKELEKKLLERLAAGAFDISVLEFTYKFA